MKEWILRITVTVLIFSIFNMLLPRGKTATVIKSVMSFITVFVMIQPVFNIDISDLEFKTFLTSDIDYQFEYIAFTGIASYKKECIKILNGYGIFLTDSELDILTDEDDCKKIKSISINLSKAVIKTDDKHIVIKDELTKTIASHFNIDERSVEIYE